MTRRPIAVLSTIVATVTLSPLFLFSCLLGFLASKYIAGSTIGEQGKLKSIVIPFRKWGIHIHHWLYSLFLMSLSTTTGIYFLTPTVSYGLLGGLVFQGIYCYSDWHVIVTSRHKNSTEERSVTKITEDHVESISSR
jgi:hypothetical protein